ncbi:hypothetical protein NHQ30_006572 [Ciborinia camelliae]|nr:hypothetical protein NHQ30_006572 [Ciborinia camelliae]
MQPPAPAPAPAIVPQPNVPINFVKAETGEIIKLGSVTLRIMEDGSRTDNRISMVELIIPAHMKGPPAHWHEMHDETFLVTKGVVTFWVPANPSTGEPEQRIDAGVGDYVVVPIRAPHTFTNETGEEARYINTFTPRNEWEREGREKEAEKSVTDEKRANSTQAFYIHYFKLLATLMEEGKEMTPEVNGAAMAYYATIPVQQK